MAYDKSSVDCVAFGEHGFASSSASSQIYTFRGPPGCHGRLVDIGVSATEDFLTGVSNGIVQVGTLTTSDAFGKLVIPNGSLDDSYINVDIDADVILSEAIPMGQLVVLTITKGVDSTMATGGGYVFVWIEWYEKGGF